MEQLKLQTSTQLLCNLRFTTSEYVYLVTCGHIWSLDQDGGHTIRSTIAENTMLHANITMFYRTAVIAN